jgi:hypothetical protein
MSLNVFISHASVDKPTARRIVEALRDKGIFPWIDEEAIRIGQSIPGMIAQGLDGADLLCVLISKAALESAWVTRELEVFLHKFLKEGRAILPCKLDKSEMPTMIANIKYANFYDDFDTGMKTLLEAVEIGEAVYERDAIRAYVDKFKAIITKVLDVHPHRSRGEMLQTLVTCLNGEEVPEDEQYLINEFAWACDEDDDYEFHNALRYNGDGTWELSMDVETAIAELSGLRSA